jgi:hypothetical protein
MTMDEIQMALKQKLTMHTQQLAAAGGPGAVQYLGRMILHYEPTEAWRYEQPRAGETYYPLAAVLAVLPYPNLRTLQEDWNEALGQDGPLPLYLHPTPEGHYTAMIGETLLLEHLILLTDECNAFMQAD